MATFQEVARGYAVRVRSAARQDGFRSRLRTRANLTESVLRRSALVAELKRIDSEISGLTVDGRGIRPEERLRIVILVGEGLGLQRPRDFDFILREASNDSFLDLTDVIWDLLQESGL